MQKNNLFIAFLFILILAITLAVYLFGLNGYFILDDYANLQRVNDLGGATLSLNNLFHYLFGYNTTGNRAISFLSFLINDNAWPGDPASYKLTNIYIHLLNGILVFILSRLVFSSATSFSKEKVWYGSLLALSVWLLHPLNVSTVLYVVQRMTELSALFSLLGIIFYIQGRLRYTTQASFKSTTWLFFGALFFITLGFLSKENAVVSLLFIIILEFSILSKHPRNKAFYALFGLCIVLPVTVLIIHFSFFRHYENAFIYRGHSQYEHILTQSRILLDYLYQIISPNTSRMGLIHDDFTVSKSLLEPISTLYSLLIISVLLLIALFSRKKWPVIFFGILWFFAGHSLESSFLPLELYFEHRNYLPGIGLIITISYLLLLLLDYIQKPFLRRLYVAIIIFTVSLFAFQTFSQATLWSNTPLQMALSYQQHPDSIRAAHNYAISIKKEQPEKALNIYKNLYRNNPTLNALLLFATESCQQKGVLPMDSNKLLQQARQLRPIGVTYFHLKNLTNSILEQGCINQPKIFLDYLFSYIENNHFLKYRGDDLSRIYYLHADIVHSSGHTKDSILLLNLAFKNNPGIAILLRQSDFLFVRKQYQDALLYIEKAIDFYHKKPYFQPVTFEFLKAKKQIIESAIEKDAQP